MEVTVSQLLGVVALEFVVIVLLGLNLYFTRFELKASRESLQRLAEASKELITANDDLRRAAERLLRSTQV